MLKQILFHSQSKNYSILLIYYNLGYFLLNNYFSFGIDVIVVVQLRLKSE